MYILIYVYTHLCIYLHVYTNIYVHTSIYVYTRKNLNISQKKLNTCTYTHACAYIHMIAFELNSQFSTQIFHNFFYSF
jgi:hypothetical protein